LNIARSEDYFLYTVLYKENISSLLYRLKRDAREETPLYGKNGLLEQHLKLNNLKDPNLILFYRDIKILNILKPKIEKKEEVKAPSLIPITTPKLIVEPKKVEVSIVVNKQNAPVLLKNTFAGKVIYHSSSVQETGPSSVLNTSKKLQWGIGGVYQFKKIKNWRLISDLQFIYINSDNPKLGPDSRFEQHFVYYVDKIVNPGLFVGVKKVSFLTANGLVALTPKAASFQHYYVGGSVYLRAFGHPSLHLGFDQKNGLKVRGLIKLFFPYFDTDISYQISDDLHNGFTVRDNRFELAFLTKEF
jgi:hypothetical protein